jgi:hypothetical protein
MIRSFVSGFTSGLSLKALETVGFDTFARRAMSSIVVNCFFRTDIPISCHCRDAPGDFSRLFGLRPSIAAGIIPTGEARCTKSHRTRSVVYSALDGTTTPEGWSGVGRCKTACSKGEQHCGERRHVIPRAGVQRTRAYVTAHPTFDTVPESRSTAQKPVPQFSIATGGLPYNQVLCRGARRSGYARKR